MTPYTAFASCYDVLTGNVDYARRAAYFCSLLERLGHEPGLSLDLACGTGSFTLELAKRGVDVYGVDTSAAMLSAAQQKAAEAGYPLLFLRQKMQELDLYGTVDTVFCTLDSLNHLVREADVRKTLERVSLFLNPGGYFLFDLNTVYKHREVLGDHVFVYDTGPVYCVWQNRYEPGSHLVRITLDLFERAGKQYRRSTEELQERAYEPEQVQEWLRAAGLEPGPVYEELTFDPPGPKTERVVMAARKGR